MSTTPSCLLCNGRGWVCSGCRRPNYRPETRNRRDFGKGTTSTRDGGTRPRSTGHGARRCRWVSIATMLDELRHFLPVPVTLTRGEAFALMLPLAELLVLAAWQGEVDSRRKDWSRDDD